MPAVTSPPTQIDWREPFSWTELATDTLNFWLGNSLDADLRVSADSVTVRSFELGRSAATVVMKDGRMLADFSEGSLMGGEVVGQVSADFNAAVPRIGIKAKLDRVDLARLSHAVVGHAIVNSPGAIVADLNAVGGTTQEILASLGGKLAIKSQAAGRLGIDLAALAATAKASEAFGWGAAGKGTTVFDQLDLRLVLRDGIVLTEHAEAGGSESALSATGMFNLAQERLDIRVTQTAPAPAAGKPAPAPSARCRSSCAVRGASRACDRSPMHRSMAAQAGASAFFRLSGHRLNAENAINNGLAGPPASERASAAAVALPPTNAHLDEFAPLH